ncbi:preprotein translocase subunit SecE [Desulfuribacillus stibiiarsenatis]|uniref:Protein translocase subunit SecE n=1 Tax=Desulfuribacillus stibiiarsenatis TaxID=1390249 RepID=A0A1E5L850_9FIRM|nr:preprotein translocase subunit SecE [Desulfuribacillus stibiiarsenatis]OEH86311.1 preprotein translocase subunit SecE [Desulfuribacillus stibiiarsenatis]
MSFVEKIRGGLTSTKEFIVEGWHELKKVRWPNRKELKGYTAVVLSVVVGITLYFYVFDLALKYVLNLFF